MTESLILMKRKSNIRGLDELTEVEEYVNSMDSRYLGTIVNLNDTYASVMFNQIPAGSYDVTVYVDEMGNAMNTPATVRGIQTIESEGVLTSVAPSSGSTYGGQEITIIGEGFHEANASLTSVMVGSNPCEISTITFR